MFWSLIVPRVQAVATILIAALVLGWSGWFAVSTVADWLFWRSQVTTVLQQLTRPMPPTAIRPAPAPPGSTP